MNPYEITFIVRPDIDDEAMRGTVDTVRGRIESSGGEILAAYPLWPGRRRLAYPIKDFGDGYYYTIDFNFDPQTVREFENSLQLNDNLLRFLVVTASDQMVKNSQQRMQQQAQQAAQAAAQAQQAAQAQAAPSGAPVAPQPQAPGVEPAPAGAPQTDSVPESVGAGAATDPGLPTEEAPLPPVVVAEPASADAVETPPQDETVPAGAYPVTPDEGE